MAEPLHILVTGGSGQIGLELTRVDWPTGVVLHLPARESLDLADAGSVRAAFDAIPFAAVINCGAYTAVDRAESEVVAAFAANALGPAALAQATRLAGVPLIHMSTDYVFDGFKQAPYVEEDAVGPLGVYGASKLAGELAVRSGNPHSVVLRTAWVFGVHRANFLKTMLRLASDRPEVRVVGDQQGCPTSARDVAGVLQTLVLRLIADAKAPTGVYHFVNSGETSWAGFASEIFSLSGAGGGPTADVRAVATADYPTLARRPSNSRLSTDKLVRDYGIRPRPWQVAAAEIIAELNADRTIA